MEKSGSLGSMTSLQDQPTPLPELHSILVHHADDDFFRGPMRPRANTDPTAPRARLHVTFDLPDIVVDDCSDNDEDYMDSSHPEEINRELRNTDEGAFFVFKSPPRQRSNTCPSNFFSRQKPRKINRPPTPPPADKVSPELSRFPSWEKVEFSPHSLSSVEEVTRDSGKSQDRTNASNVRTDSPSSRSRKHNDFHCSRLSKGRANFPNDSPSSSPKRMLPRIPNGQVTSKSSNQHRDHVIHSTA